MRIRIVKPLPAPMMDGFNVRDLRVGQVYDLDSRMGNYLIVAGYGARVETEQEPPLGKEPRR